MAMSFGSVCCKEDFNKGLIFHLTGYWIFEFDNNLQRNNDSRMFGVL